MNSLSTDAVRLQQRVASVCKPAINFSVSCLWLKGNFIMSLSSVTVMLGFLNTTESSFE